MVQDYGYTVPRRPIAAMFASPGPALYTLPTLLGRKQHDPRSVHVCYPAYSLASRVFMHKQAQSPGPKYFPPAKVCSVINACVSILAYTKDANKDLSPKAKAKTTILSLTATKAKVNIHANW